MSKKNHRPAELPPPSTPPPDPYFRYTYGLTEDDKCPKGGTTNVKGWTTETKRVKACEFLDKTNSDVVLPAAIDRKIVALSEAMGNKEWLGYLVGTVGDHRETDFVVSDIFVPKQVVSAGSCTAEEGPKTGVIGTVHSHHSMGSFHSDTDDTYIGQNHDVTIVYSTKDGYKGKVRRKLPCGSIIYNDIEVVGELVDDPETEAFVKAALTKIEEEKPVVGEHWLQGGVDYVGSNWWKQESGTRKTFCGSCHKEIEGTMKYVGGVFYHLNCPSTLPEPAKQPSGLTILNRCALCDKTLGPGEGFTYAGKQYCYACDYQRGWEGMS